MRIPSILSLGPAGPSPRPNAALLLQGKRPRVVAGLALTALALTVALWATDATKVGSAFHAMASRPVLLGAFLAAYRLAFGLRAMAWRRLEPRLSALGAFSILQTALFANHVLPLKGGDVIRPLLAARRGVPLTEAVASSVAARVIDFAALIAIAGTLIAWSPRGMSLSPAALLLPPASVGAAALLLIWLRADGAIPPMPRRLELAVARVRAATRRMSNRRLASAMAWTLPSWLLEGAVLYVAARAMGAEVSPAAAVAATAFTILFQAFHFTPGGIGVYEASMTAALAAHGVPLEHGLALAVFTHGLKFGYSYTAGLAFTLLEQRHALGMGAVGKRHWASVRPAAAARWVPAVAALATAALSHGWNQRGWEAWAGLGVAAAAVAPLALVLSRVRFNGPLLVVAGGLALAALPLFGAPGAVDTALFMGVFALSALALGRGLSAVGLAGSLLAGLALYVSVAGGGIGAGVEVAAYAAAAGIAMLLLRQWVPAWVPLPAAPARRSGPLVVIVPALNEAANLPRTLAAVPRGAVTDLRVVVVDDGSTDGTSEVARSHGADVVARHERNRGLGAALRTGLSIARDLDCRAAVYVDADGEYDPAGIPALVEPIERDGFDYVLGSRYRGSRVNQRLSRNLANRPFTVALSVAAGRRITDGQTGFRAFSRRAVDAAEIIHDYNYAQVLTLDLSRKRMRMAEVPVCWRPREHGTSFIRAEYLWRVPAGIVRQLLRA